MLDRDRDRRLSVKRHLSGDHLIERNTERIDVGTGIRISATDLLRRTVMDRSHRIGTDGVGGCRAGDPEVRHLHLAVCRDNDILRLHVAVYDPLRVCSRKAHTYLDRDACCLPNGKLSLFRNIILEGDSLDQLHYYIIIARILPHVKNIDDIGVCQTGRSLRLSPELGNERPILPELRLHDLDRDETIQLRIHRLIDIGHSARAYTADNLVSLP